MTQGDAEAETPQHYLIVADYDEMDDILEVEHDDSCPLAPVYYGGPEEVMDYNCLVGQLVAEAGIDHYFHRQGDSRPGYATTPLTPGRYGLRSYMDKRPVAGYANTYEVDAGLEVNEKSQ